MKSYFFLFLCLLIIGCSQAEMESTQTGNYKLSVNPNVDTSRNDHKKITLALENFLSSKNESLIANRYWEPSDFEKYPYPYYDIFQIEKGKSGPNTYLPTLLAILPAKEKNEHVLKIGFMASPDSSGTYLRAVFNLLSIQEEEEIRFKRILDHNTAEWRVEKYGSITYYISPQKKFSLQEVQQQEVFIKQLCQFFNTSSIPLQYYSCVSPEEIFQIRGFDFEPQMYLSDKGGQNEVWSGIIYSGNASERYEHEIVHSYLYQLYRPHLHRLFDEGMAMYLGGSSQLPYSYHRQSVKNYLEEHPELDLRDFLDPYDRFTIGKYTSLSYTVGALICEYAYRTAGKDALLALFQSGKEVGAFWTAIYSLGFSPENFNEKLRHLLNEEVVVIFD